MDPIIDVAGSVADHVEALAEAGVRTVVRYYNHRNSTALPSKCLTRAEAEALHAAGLATAVVFQQRGGAGGDIGDLDAQSGRDDARRALALAREVGQPRGSAIYFAVDHDFVAPAALASIANYFEAARSVVGDDYRVGVYGSGLVASRARDAGAELVWLAGARAWSGTREALDAGRWTLFQERLHAFWSPGRFYYDGNVLNPDAGGDFGQWPVSAPDGATPDKGAADGRPVSTRDLQNRLNTLGAVPRLAVDGILGPRTWAAVFHALKQRERMSPAALSDEALRALGLIDRGDAL